MLTTVHLYIHYQGLNAFLAIRSETKVDRNNQLKHATNEYLLLNKTHLLVRYGEDNIGMQEDTNKE